MRSILPLSLFVLGCFPSRGLYFLLHPASAAGRYHASQPVLNAPSNPIPRWKAAKVPLPARLTRVPRSLKQTPFVPAPTLGAAFVQIPAKPAYLIVSIAPDLFLPQRPPASPPPSRAPPAAV